MTARVSAEYETPTMPNTSERIGFFCPQAQRFRKARIATIPKTIATGGNKNDSRARGIIASLSTKSIEIKSAIMIRNETAERQSDTIPAATPLFVCAKGSNFYEQLFEAVGTAHTVQHGTPANAGVLFYSTIDVEMGSSESICKMPPVSTI